jgi:hypothetical protein
MKKPYVLKFLVVSPSRFNKQYTVHSTACRYFYSAHGVMLEAKDIPEDAVDCKVCGGRKP